MSKHLYSRQPTKQEAINQFEMVWELLSNEEQSVIYNLLVDMEKLRK